MKNTQLNHSDHRKSNIAPSLCLLVHDISLPANIGSLFRLADAFALEHIYLSGKSPVPPNRKISKTSRSTEKYVAHSYNESPLEITAFLKEKGYILISLEITSSSIELSTLNLPNGSKVCLILGDENQGVGQELIDLSDEVVHIPMLGENSSMNVAMACGIAVYDIVRKLATV